jgi:hypothetical protein
MQFTATIAELNSAAANLLAEYWERKRGDRRMPARADIDPIELKPILPIIILAQIEPKPFRVFYRLVGTRAVENGSFDYTGHYLDRLNFSSEHDTDWPAIYRLIYRNRRPIHGFGAVKLKDGSVHNYASAVFPLSSDGETVDHCIAIEDLDLNLLERERLPRSGIRTDD